MLKFASSKTNGATKMSTSNGHLTNHQTGSLTCSEKYQGDVAMLVEGRSTSTSKIYVKYWLTRRRGGLTAFSLSSHRTPTPVSDRGTSIESWFEVRVTDTDINRRSALTRVVCRCNDVQR
ncbi:hypothetical protein BaRGS_00033495 [Batillaria attramentaria]|uniref:Uncharacterized protein n=1 Tax=Batillaria attramentaria TaxID=370345 RepID=A0ABD0JJW2_9CAEN